MISKIVLKTEDISNIIDGKFVFCKELKKGFIKRDISSLGVVTFEEVATAIEALSLEALEIAGLDSVTFLDGSIGFSTERNLKINKQLNLLSSENRIQTFIDNMLNNEAGFSRYFDINNLNITNTIGSILGSLISFDTTGGLADYIERVDTGFTAGSWSQSNNLEVDLFNMLCGNTVAFGAGYRGIHCGATADKEFAVKVKDMSYFLNIGTFYVTQHDTTYPSNPYKIYTSNDGETWTLWHEETNNRTDGYTVTKDKTLTKYIKIWVKGSDGGTTGMQMAFNRDDFWDINLVKDENYNPMVGTIVGGLIEGSADGYDYIESPEHLSDTQYNLDVSSYKDVTEYKIDFDVYPLESENSATLIYLETMRSDGSYSIICDAPNLDGFDLRTSDGRVGWFSNKLPELTWTHVSITMNTFESIVTINGETFTMTENGSKTLFDINTISLFSGNKYGGLPSSKCRIANIDCTIIS